MSQPGSLMFLASYLNGHPLLRKFDRFTPEHSSEVFFDCGVNEKCINKLCDVTLPSPSVVVEIFDVASTSKTDSKKMDITTTSFCIIGQSITN